MADYINKNILSQAYIHVEPVALDSEEDIERLKQHIKDFARTRSDFYLHPDVDVEIEFEEGSLKARVTVIGTLFLLLQGVSNYSDFREGAVLLYNDSKRLAEYIVSEMQFLSGAKHQDVIRLESRTGVVGSLNKVTRQLAYIRRASEGSLSASEITTQLQEVQDEIKKLLENLSDQQDIELVKNGLKSLADTIPSIPKPPKERTNSPTAIGLYQRERRSLRRYFALDE